MNTRRTPRAIEDWAEELSGGGIREEVFIDAIRAAYEAGMKAGLCQHLMGPTRFADDAMEIMGRKIKKAIRDLQLNRAKR